MWFYWNVVSFHIIFVVTHGEIFSLLGHTGPVTVNKMALPSMYRWRWRHIHAFIGRNTIAFMVQRFAAGANIICLTYTTDWWAVIGPVIHGEAKSQATRSSSDHVGLLNRLGVALVLEVLAKLMVRENLSWEFPKVGVRLILEVHLILETRQYMCICFADPLLKTLGMWLMPLWTWPKWVWRWEFRTSLTFFHSVCL